MGLIYLIVIIFSNIITAAIPPINLLGLLIPCGTLFIGATFVLRDLCQEKYGRKNIYKLIVLAMVLSGVGSFILGDGLSIVFASCISFLISETADTEIYTRLKLPMHIRVMYSGVVGGLLDSVLFVILGLSPIGSGVLTWAMVPSAILGQIIFKIVMQFIGCLIIKHMNKNK